MNKQKYQLWSKGIHRFTYEGTLDEAFAFAMYLEDEEGIETSVLDETGVLMDDQWDDTKNYDDWDGLKVTDMYDSEPENWLSHSDDDYESARDAELIESMIREEQDTPEAMEADLDFIRTTYLD